MTTIGRSIFAAALVFGMTSAAAGSIEGKVTASATGLPISTGFVRIHDATGKNVGLASMNRSGDYVYGGLADGTYFARTTSTGFYDELWDGKPCPQDDCVVTSGTPITVGSGVTTANFVLDKGGSITGKVTASVTGMPISRGFVRIHDATGKNVGLASMNSSGDYTYGGLAVGTYFARTTSTGFYDELWNGKPCPQDDCVATSGTPIVVGPGATTANFILDKGGSITGKVTAIVTGLPISAGFVRIHDATGGSVGLASMNNSGDYTYGGLAAGTYFARTTSTGFYDQLWNNLPCAQGNCVITSGTPIPVASTGSTQADFALSGSSDVIFRSGFEAPVPSQMEAGIPMDALWGDTALDAQLPRATQEEGMQSAEGIER